MAEKKQPFDLKVVPTRYKKGRRKAIFRTIVNSLFAFLLVLFIVAGGAAAAVVVNYVNEAPPFNPSHLAAVETSYIYDSKGNEIAVLHDEQNRIVVDLDSVPEHVRNAFVAIEDERFFNHYGFDVISSMRAAYVNYRAGKILQGGSTITQQLAQNAFLTTEMTYRRKIQEIWLAIQLERNYGKEEILEFYLNRIYFGNGAYGIEAAAQTYFAKPAANLSIAEAALLAGVVHSPNNLNPVNNKAEAEQRMRTVLSSLERLGFISAAEHNTALQQQLVYAELSSPDYHFPYFVDYVVHRELIDILSAMPSIGSREEAYRAIYNGGLRVYTTLDPNMQIHVEEVLNRTDLYPATVYLDMPGVREASAALPPDQDLTRAQLEALIDEEGGVPQPQAAIVLADPITGRIRALGGGREYRKTVDEVLRFANLRQPGSAIKPIIAYAPAFEEGVLTGASSTIDDSPFTGPHGWRPKNFDNRFRGLMPAREALYYSYNIPAVRVFQALGTRVGVGYAERMGISTIDPSEVDNLALTLGGFTYGVRAIDMAQAYSVLANDGIRVDLYTVEKIEDRHGAVLYEQKINPRQIISPQAAFIVNDILQDFVTEYLGRALQIDRPVAAKTGTTENWKDVYIVAYTPNLVASFWMGYDEPRIGGIQQGWRYSTAFLREVFLEAFKTLEIREFMRPTGIVTMDVCTVSGLRPLSNCRSAGTVRSDYFIERNAPRGFCDIHLGLVDHTDDDLDDDFTDDQPEPPEDDLVDDDNGQGQPPSEDNDNGQPPSEDNDNGVPPDNDETPVDNPPNGQGDGSEEDIIEWWQIFLRERKLGDF